MLRRRVLFLTTFVIILGTAIGATLLARPTYQASAKVLVSSSSSLSSLMSALDFDRREIAAPLFDQYRYALDLVHNESFDYPKLMFKELLQVWDTAVMGQRAMAQT